MQSNQLDEMCLDVHWKATDGTFSSNFYKVTALELGTFTGAKKYNSQLKMYVHNNELN
jgi:hypothetical protein